MELEEYINKKGLAPKWPFWLEQQIDVVLEYAEQLEQDAEKAEAEVVKLREQLKAIRDLARTGLKPDVYPTEEDWLFHKCNRIAGMAQMGLWQKE